MDAAFVKKQQKKLLEDKAKIEEQLKSIKASDPFSDPDHAVDNASSDTDAREEMGHITAEAEMEDLNKRLHLIVAALKRIDKGTYGICLKTHKRIPKARLLLVPEAEFAI